MKYKKTILSKKNKKNPDLTYLSLFKKSLLLAAQRAGKEEGQEGLIRYFEKQALENPGLFINLLGKLLVMHTVSDQPDNRLQHVTHIEIVAPEHYDSKKN